MLEKIQSISTNLDKKRIYTALGALVVALATGHVMQRTVSKPNVVVDVPVQQAAVAPAMSAPQAQPVEVAERAPDPLPVPDEVVGVAEVTMVDMTPATEPLAPMATPAVVDVPDQTAPQIELASADMPDGDTPEVTKPALSDMVSDPVLAEEPAAPSPDDAIELAEVTRSALDDGLPMPELSSPEFDVKQADIEPNAPEQVADGKDCTPTFSLAPLPAALIYAELSAPCDAGANVEFDHVGLKFTETLDDEGKLTVMVPAMTSEAVISAQIEGRDAPIERMIEVSDMAEYDRIALAWQGGTGLQLHALENGAWYGEEGHIWAEEPKMPSRATEGVGGFVTVLGSTIGGFAADVYTYPLSMQTAPAISIEAQVLESTCGNAIVGDYLRSVQDGVPTDTQVGMVVPACDAVGEYLVLKNLPQDLTIARN